MAKIAKRTKRYPSDLTDEEWSAVERFLPKTAAVGSPRRIGHLSHYESATLLAIREMKSRHRLTMRFATET
jgi:hypothetical protein